MDLAVSDVSRFPLQTEVSSRSFPGWLQESTTTQYEGKTPSIHVSVSPISSSSGFGHSVDTRST